MPFGLKDNDYKLIKNVFHSISKIEEVIVFGSRAMGTEKPGSDVDLALIGNDITLNDILKLKHQLEELPIIYDFDVINYHTINTPALIEHIDRHGILFYKKEIVPNEWKTYRLDELCIKITDGSHFSPKEKLNGEKIIASVKDMNNNGIDYQKCKKISKEDFDILVKNDCQPLAGDVLFSKDGTMGIVYFCKEKLDLVLLSSIAILRPNNDIVDGNFLAYWLKNPQTNKDIQDNYKSGSALPRIVLKDFKKLELSIPRDITTQTQIAQILTSLDDKIELNLQMNQTLEAMAQAIFKEWFVDFKFPRFDGQLVNGLPKGWKKEALDEKICFLNGLALQKFPPKNETEYLPVIKIRELKQGISESSDKASTEIDKKYIIEDGDILFSWSGSLVVVMWCNGKGALNQHLFKVSSEKYPKWFYYYWTKEFLPIFQATATDKATTMGHIQRRHLTGSLINDPDKDTLKLANEILEPLLEKIKLNAIQIQTLIQTRDSLLPRLMSGKIEIQKI